MPAPTDFDMRLFLSGVLAFFAAGAVPPLYGVTLPLWSEAYGLAEGQGGWLLAANGTGSFLAVLAGFLGVPGLGIRTGLAGLALGALILALAGGWGVALVGALATGLGFGVLMAAVNRSFLGGFGARSAGMVGLVNAVYGFGAILSPLGFLAAGSRPAIAFATVASLAVLGLALAPADPGSARRGLPDLRDRRLLVTLFICGNGLIEGLSVGFGASALVSEGLAEDTAAGLTSAFFMAYLLARLMLYWLTRHVGSDRLFLIGTAGAGAAMALAALGLPGAGYVAAGAFVGLIFPTYYPWAISILGPDPRMTSAILTAALLGGLVSPILVQPILATAGEDAVLGIVAVTGLVVAAAFALLKDRCRRLGPT